MKYERIVILSYDPFLIGDMYYEAKMHLSTHPDYNYDDGRTFILLYADGKPNFEDMVYGKKVPSDGKAYVTVTAAVKLSQVPFPNLSSFFPDNMISFVRLN